MRAEELITFERAANRVVARWHGDIDVAISTAIEERTLEAVANTDEDLVLDLSLVTYIDSAGLRSLVTMMKLLAMRQQRLVLVLPERSPLRRGLEVGGVLRVLQDYPTLAAAEAALG